ncbi:hypothetical protein F4553_005190 [Allocatelliglobosispora scoriae]|uniref:DUF4097 domain-containing protein n=1 Tax=Allocatelliglobosispora scoriae TaxID=643052 RepID=A0A841BYR6_9ACTN|nr:DUF4097 family beta strand repeat-containing protein [Allocatelliglobosispora scoriae]MBB5871811.1 hypothetical protein [Allocatelliglobosispora scoriae]
MTIHEPVDRLEVWLVKGRLNIVAAPGPCRVEVNDSGGTKLRLTADNGRLRLRHGRGRRWLAHLSWRRWAKRRSEITIGVPPQTVVDLRMNEANVTVSGLRASTSVNVTSGRISLLGVGGTTTVKLVSGDVEAMRVSGELSMQTVSGDLALAESSASKVRGKTISGTITCDLDEPLHTELAFHTISGDITLRIPAESDLAVALRTASGRITSSFAEIVDPGAKVFTNHAEGVLGRGTGKLTAATTSGDVSLLAGLGSDELG